MTTWKDGGYRHDIFGHDVINEEDGRSICRVFTKQVGDINSKPTPWPDERNFHLILKAPETAKALNMIAEGAIVSPEQPPEKIAEQVLRVFQLVREENLEYRKIIGAQQRQVAQMLAALESIMAVKPPCWSDLPAVLRIHPQCRAIARDAIAAVKGEDSEDVENHNDELA